MFIDSISHSSPMRLLLRSVLGMKIQNLSSSSQQSCEFMEALDNSFSFIVGTEILVHIAFNPDAFWQQVCEQFNSRGRIYNHTKCISDSDSHADV